MLTIIPMSQARRRLRRLVALVAKGHTFIITKNGKPLVLLDAPKQPISKSSSQGIMRHREPMSPDAVVSVSCNRCSKACHPGGKEVR